MIETEGYGPGTPGVGMRNQVWYVVLQNQERLQVLGHLVDVELYIVKMENYYPQNSLHVHLANRGLSP